VAGWWLAGHRSKPAEPASALQVLQDMSRTSGYKKTEQTAYWYTLEIKINNMSYDLL